MPSILFPSGWRLTDANGKPVNNGKINIYEAGTTTPLATYSNIGLSTAHASPIRTNSAGRIKTAGGSEAAVYTDGATNFKVVATTSADVALFTDDNQIPYISNAGVVPVANGGTNSSTAANARTSTAAASG